MILNPNFYHHAQDEYLDDSPPHLRPRPPFPHQAPVGFSYSVPQYPVFQQPFSTSYPLQGPSYPHQQQPFMIQHRSAPPQARPIHPSLLNDPAFSPDPRSNPYFFSMNDREEIYPASLSDSLSDYASIAPDDESEVDHSNLPPRLRMLHSPDSKAQPLPQHLRSQSVPYPPIASSDQNHSRSHSTRVIPIPPPISRASASGAPFRSSREDLRQNEPGSASLYASAFVAPRDLWQPPPPYSESESGSSSSSPNQTPASSSSHLPREAQRSTSSLPPTSAYPEDKTSPTRSQPPSPTSASSNPRLQTRTPPRNAPAQENNTSSVQSAAARPSIAPRNASAPDLHPPPPPTELPPRPSTVPIAAPTNSSVSAPVAQRKRSKNASLSAAPRDLDRIDELDESDPLGFAWHHDGPYEAIAKANSAHNLEQAPSGQKRTEPSKRKPVQYGSTALGVAPGQIFPSNSQYQPPSQRDVAQYTNARGPENMPPGSSLPSSPLMQVPVQRRVPPSGVLPSSPELYNNKHMSVMQAQEQQSSRTLQPPSPVQPQRSRRDEQPQPSPPLTNPYSPAADSRFPEGVQNQRNSPPHTRAPPAVPGRPELPSSNIVPHPDISLPPQQQAKSSSSLLPRHLPKRLVMPAPLQPNQQQANQQMHDGRGAAHVEVLAQRHASQPPPAAPPSARSGAPSLQSQPSQQHGRAQDIPFGQGPKVLRKRHTTGGVPLSIPMQMQMPMVAGAEIPASNTTAALFAARVRFAEPPREETKEERKRREKEQARRDKEREKMEKTRAKEQGGGVFARDQVREAELARECEMARAQASTKSSAGRKLSKRR